MSLKARLARLEADAEAAEATAWPPLYLPPQLPIDDGFERSASPAVWRAFLLALENRERPDAELEALVTAAGGHAWLVQRLRDLSPTAADNRQRMCRFALAYFARHGRPFRNWHRRSDAGDIVFDPSGGSWDVPAEPCRDWEER